MEYSSFQEFGFLRLREDVKAWLGDGSQPLKSVSRERGHYSRDPAMSIGD